MPAKRSGRVSGLASRSHVRRRRQARALAVFDAMTHQAGAMPTASDCRPLAWAANAADDPSEELPPEPLQPSSKGFPTDE
jgi:hypothetical protein